MNTLTADALNTTSPPGNDLRVSLSKLILLEREARRAESLDHLAFIAANQTHRLVEYYQGVCWAYRLGEHISVKTVSGVSTIDPHAPAMFAVKKIVKALVQAEQPTEIKSIGPANLPEKLQAEWKQWLPENGLWCPFVKPDGTLMGGLLLTRAQPFVPAEVGLLENLMDAYAHAWLALERARRKGIRAPRKRWVGVAVAGLLVASLFVPIRESALAPAEIVAHQPLVVTAPLRGVIKEIHVRPNAVVEAGQLLFSMDDTDIRSRYEVAQKSLDVAKADYLRAAQKSFSDSDSKSELNLYKARVEEAALERDYAATLLERTRVRAERDGVAIFADENDWIGQPVVQGQRILTLADPQQTEIQIWLEVEDGINLEVDSQVLMFLNTNPNAPLRGRIHQTSYEPERTPAESLAFRLKAELETGQATPRIGLKGTAKVYGDRVFLFYHVLRRPLSALRQTLGL